MIKKYAVLLITAIVSYSCLDAMSALIKKQNDISGKPSLPYQSITEEEELQQAIKASIETKKEEEAAILAPGVYLENARIIINELEVNFQVLQIAVTDPQNKENVTCGPRVLFVADAIDRLYGEKKTINPETIAGVLALNNDYTNAIKVCANQLDDRDIPEFIKQRKLNISQYFVVGRSEDPLMIIPYIPQIAPQDFETALKDLGQKIKADEIKVPIHFIFSDIKKAHWVLITVIKKEGSAPEVYYMDPMNKKLSLYSVARDCLEYLIEKLGLL